MLKKLKTRSVETKNALSEYKKVADINLLAKQKWVFSWNY